MKRFVKQILHPARRRAAQFVRMDETVNHLIETFPNHSIIHKAAEMIAGEKIEGDYLEFGVFAGASFIRAYKTIKMVFDVHQVVFPGRTEQDVKELGALWNKMRYFAFDSFEGLPELEGIDKQTQEFSAGKFSFAETAFRSNIQQAGVPLDRIITVPGWFNQTCTPETIQKHQMKKAAIIHVDCDLYTSAKTVLDFVGPLMADGAILIFDDWFCYRGSPFLGEQRAFNEWKEGLPGWIFTEYQKEGPHRNSFIATKLPEGE